jgi:hypothetical protein
MGTWRVVGLFGNPTFLLEEGDGTIVTVEQSRCTPATLESQAAYWKFRALGAEREGEMGRYGIIEEDAEKDDEGG